MNSNEEYLDNLLKSMGDDDKKPEKDNNAIMTSDEIEAMFAAAEKAAGTNIPTNQESNNSIESESIDTIDIPKDDLSNYTVESTQDISADDIEKLLEESEQSNDPIEKNSDDMDKAVEYDLDALLQNLDVNDDLNEINELLKKADNNEPVVDMKSEDSNHTEEIDQNREKEVPEENNNSDKQDIDQKEQKKKKKKRENRRKKEENQDLQSKEVKKDSEKKKGILGALFSVLMTEGDTDADADTTSENQSIMEELDAEDREEANRKKKLKKGKVLSKASSKASSKEVDEEDTDTKKTGKAKDKKPKKAAKPKKEKTPKKVKEETNEKPSKKISKKSIFVVLLFSVSVFAALLFGIYIGSNYIQTNSAVKAFENQDYITCYEQLYGMKLSENQSNMFHHAEVVLKMQRRIDMYEKYLNEDKELEAVDSLMQALANYEELYVKAQSYGATGEVADLYSKILVILKEQYDLTEEDARAIADCTSNVEYTRYLTALIGGETVSSDENTDGIVLPKQEMQDVLPAEEELVAPDFAD